jgi:DNA polymerase III alpha subunit (gram-positive type)
MQGGLELFQAGTRGLKRELVIQLETSALTPEKGEIIHFYAVNRWDEEDEFDEWAKPLVALSAEAERILGVTNVQLAECRSTDVVLDDFWSFLTSNCSEKPDSNATKNPAIIRQLG